MDARSLVTVHIKFLGFLAQLAQQTELELQVEPGSTVADLLYLVAERLGPDFRQALLDWHGNLHGGVEIILDQQHISARKISEIDLWENSHLIIMPLIGGGRSIDSIEGIMLLVE
jgi:hypothetical protein